MTNQRLFLDNLANTLHITQLEGWYQLSLQTLKEHGGLGLLDKYGGSTTKMLRCVYPEYPSYHNKVNHHDISGMQPNLFVYQPRTGMNFQTKKTS